MAWCLTKQQQENFKKALVDKKINPFTLPNMTSDQRRALFSEYVNEENAININSLYESKLLLKNQQRGLENWVKRSLGMTPAIKRDLTSKIGRLSELGVLSPADFKSFKQDLARTRLGINMTFEEAKTINDLAQTRAEVKERWDNDLANHPEWSEKSADTRSEFINNKHKIEYGLRGRALENYVNDLKLESRKVRFKEDPQRAIGEAVKAIPAVMKSMMATLDNSFFGRQGIKALFGSFKQKKIWGRAFVGSFKDIMAELGDKKIDGFDTMDLIKADIYSRPNAMNGKYKAGNYRLGVLNEEAFPTSLPERVPLLGRLFKAAETAFSGGALRMRADLADLLIQKAEAAGVNTLNTDEAKAMGHLVGSMTGRGSLGKFEPGADVFNVLFFSARFLKSNVDTLTAHSFDRKATKFTKKEARRNLLNIVVNIASILTIAKLIDPESVDEDPDSTNFGKIKMFDKWVDITGGMRGLIIPISRIIPRKRNGVWGMWQKSSSGRWSNLSSGTFGQRDAMDMLLDSFLLNKLSPIAAIMRDAIRNKMFGGDPFNLTEAITNSLTPLSIQKFSEVKDEKFGDILGIMMAEFVGLSVDTYKFNQSWASKNTKEMKEFKSQVGEDLFKQANDDYNRAYNLWLEVVREDPKYKKLSDEGKKKLENDARGEIKEKILDEYGYVPEVKFETSKEIKERFDRKDLLP